MQKINTTSTVVASITNSVLRQVHSSSKHTRPAYGFDITAVITISLKLNYYWCMNFFDNYLSYIYSTKPLLPSARTLVHLWPVVADLYTMSCILG